MVAIQEKVIKQSKRNVFFRHFYAKNDKEKIAAWKADLNRILNIFNVGFIVSVWLLLTLPSRPNLRYLFPSLGPMLRTLTAWSPKSIASSSRCGPQAGWPARLVTDPLSHICF